jgi:hypothetical protein
MTFVAFATGYPIDASARSRRLSCPATVTLIRLQPVHLKRVGISQYFDAGRARRAQNPDIAL